MKWRIYWASKIFEKIISWQENYIWMNVESVRRNLIYILELEVDEEEVMGWLKRNCSLIALSLGGNQIKDELLEKIEEELACNRGISDMILPIINTNESELK